MTGLTSKTGVILTTPVIIEVFNLISYGPR